MWPSVCITILSAYMPSCPRVNASWHTLGNSRSGVTSAGMLGLVFMSLKLSHEQKPTAATNIGNNIFGFIVMSFIVFKFV